MKVKQTLKYYAWETGKTLGIYYIVILCLQVASLILSGAITGRFDLSNISIDSTTGIFLFVFGLNMFKSPLRLLAQNGISRKTQFVCTALTALGLAVAATLVEWVYSLIVGSGYESLFLTIYSRGLLTAAQSTLLNLGWNCLGYLAAFCVGLMITTLYYRMNKALKVLVSVGVPGFLLIGLPVMEGMIPTFHGFTSLVYGISWAFGIDVNTGQIVPARAMGTLAIISLAAMACMYLLMRRATLKEA